MLTMSLAASSRTMLDTVPDASPVSRVRSDWVRVLPPLASSADSTRRWLASRSDVADPGASEPDARASTDMRKLCATSAFVVKQENKWGTWG